MIDISNELYKWLQQEFYRSNHRKYHKYFEEWVDNVTYNQISGFNNQMIGQLTKSKIINNV